MAQVSRSTAATRGAASWVADEYGISAAGQRLPGRPADGRTDRGRPSAKPEAGATSGVNGVGQASGRRSEGDRRGGQIAGGAGGPEPWTGRPVRCRRPGRGPRGRPCPAKIRRRCIALLDEVPARRHGWGAYLWLRRDRNISRTPGRRSAVLAIPAFHPAARRAMCRWPRNFPNRIRMPPGTCSGRTRPTCWPGMARSCWSTTNCPPAGRRSTSSRRCTR